MKRLRPPNPIPQRSRSGRRHGVILVAVLVCLAVVGSFAMSLLRTAAARRRGAEAQQWRLQAQWLAESGLERAAVRLNADPRYAGEVWTPPPAELGGHAAVVRIEVKPRPASPTAAPSASRPISPTIRTTGPGKPKKR